PPPYRNPVSVPEAVDDREPVATAAVRFGRNGRAGSRLAGPVDLRYSSRLFLPGGMRRAAHDQRRTGEVRDYETVYIFDTQIPEDRINEKLDRFHGLLTGGGAEITAVDHWGRRQLTYPIRKQNAGYYVVAQFRSEAGQLPEYERLMKLDDELLRYIVVLHEGEPTAPMSIATRAPRDDEEEEEE